MPNLHQLNSKKSKKTSKFFQKKILLIKIYQPLWTLLSISMVSFYATWQVSQAHAEIISEKSAPQKSLGQFSQESDSRLMPKILSNGSIANIRSARKLNDPQSGVLVDQIDGRLLLKADVGYWRNFGDNLKRRDGASNASANGNSFVYGASLGYVHRYGFGLSADYIGFNRRWSDNNTTSSHSENYFYQSRYHIISLTPSYRFQLDRANSWGLRLGLGIGLSLADLRVKSVNPTIANKGINYANAAVYKGLGPVLTKQHIENTISHQLGNQTNYYVCGEKTALANWIVAEKIVTVNNRNSLYCNGTELSDLDQQLKTWGKIQELRQYNEATRGIKILRVVKFDDVESSNRELTYALKNGALTYAAQQLPYANALVPFQVWGESITNVKGLSSLGVAIDNDKLQTQPSTTAEPIIIPKSVWSSPQSGLTAERVIKLWQKNVRFADLPQDLVSLERDFQTIAESWLADAAVESHATPSATSNGVTGTITAIPLTPAEPLPALTTLTPADQPKSLSLTSLTDADEPMILPLTMLTPADQPKSMPATALTPAAQPVSLSLASLTDADEPMILPLTMLRPVDQPKSMPATALTPADQPKSMPATALTPADQPKFLSLTSLTDADEPMILPLTMLSPAEPVTASMQQTALIPLTPANTAPQPAQIIGNDVIVNATFNANAGLVFSPQIALEYDFGLLHADLSLRYYHSVLRQDYYTKSGSLPKNTNLDFYQKNGEYIYSQQAGPLGLLVGLGLGLNF